MNKTQPKNIYLKNYRPPAYFVDRAELHFDLLEEFTIVKARHFCRRNKETGAKEPVVLNGRDMELISLTLDGSRLENEKYLLGPESLTVFDVPQTFSLEIETKIRPQDNTSLEGLYKSSGNFCTQCEAQGFRKITYFIDRPDVMARYDVTIVADQIKYPVLLANGNLVESGPLPDNKHYARWQDPFPKPSYLFAMVAGDLARLEDKITTASGREVLLQIYVEHHNKDKCDHAMRALKKAMRWDEEVFGLEYDLARYMIVAVDDFNMGAMENKGLNIFNSKYVLARPETATDDDYEGIEAVIGHEYFHNWTGNRVTCRDWFQLSLKEGLTVFRDQEFSAVMSSPAVKRISDVRLLRNRQFPEDGGPMAHAVRPEAYMEINNFYTLTVYEKGSEIIRMMQTILGKEGFRKGITLYLGRHDGQAVTTDDFVRAMEDANHADLGRFKLWYSQAGTPELQINSVYDQKTNIYYLSVRQTCPPTPGQAHKEPLHIPFAVGLLGKKGGDLPLQLENEERPCSSTTMVLNVRKSEETFRFTNVLEEPVPSVLRGFSAPVKWTFPYSREQLLFLLLHDSDTFSRWEAGQLLYLDVMMPLIEVCRQKKKMSINGQLIGVYQNILNDVTLSDNSFKTLLLTLPSEEYLGEMMAVIDVDAVHKVREFVIKELATALKDDFLAVYYDNVIDVGYSFDPVSVGRRRLKNFCLGNLVKLGDINVRELCLRQFRDADNMTDRLSALRNLVHAGCPEGQEALADFHDRWHDDTLVMDKWFAIQATAPLPETLENVKKLMRHSGFSMRNPNRVRALIGAFCTGNPVCFHEKSGTGYTFLADRILALDPLNSQIAAKLLQNLSRWQRYDGVRKNLIKKQLERIAGNSKLSKDVYEVAAKSLGDSS